jgi:polyisoprenoid-binding protein YceI
MKQCCIILFLFIGISATSQNEKYYTLNIDQSVLKWRGTYAFQFSEHSGTVKFKMGTLTTLDDHISGGSFVIDMHSITNEDYENDIGPVGHLKNDDFFDVPKYPEALLKITKVTFFQEENKHKMDADLTIKGITKPIEFWSTVDSDKKQLYTQFKIDRRRWGITYNNKLKNHAISDAIEFEVLLDF